MTATRIWQAGAELQTIDELETDVTTGASAPTTSTTKKRTGGYAFRYSGRPYGLGKAFSATQIRGGVFLNHESANVGGTADRVHLLSLTGAFPMRVVWNGDDNAQIVVNGVVQASVSILSVIPLTDNWYHLGVSAFADPVNGYISFYVDGILKLTWTGNTGSSFSGFYLGGANSGNALWSNPAYFDDFYVDAITGGEPDQPPQSPRFPFLLVNNAGDYTNWTPNAGVNYQNVDDAGAPDGDTTYNYALATNVKDAFAIENTTPGVTVPPGYGIKAVIPASVSRKTDSGFAPTVIHGMRDGAGNEQSDASGLPLLTSYTMVWNRYPLTPLGANWSESAVDAAQIILKSGGTFL